MLTVKLLNEKTKRTRSVECVEVISESEDGIKTVLIRKPDGSDERVRIWSLREIMTDADYSVAYVENAQGRTIQTVRP